MIKKKKFPRESFVSMTELVLPNDTNTLNNLMGGRLMHWMDIVSAISAQKHSNCMVVTASVDNISFKHPIRLGNVVTLKANVTRAFNTSMEVRIYVEAEDIPSGNKIDKCLQCRIARRKRAHGREIHLAMKRLRARSRGIGIRGHDRNNFTVQTRR